MFGIHMMQEDSISNSLMVPNKKKNSLMVDSFGVE